MMTVVMTVDEITVVGTHVGGDGLQPAIQIVLFQLDVASVSCTQRTFTQRSLVGVAG